MKFKCWIPHTKLEYDVMIANSIDVDEFYLSYEEFVEYCGEHHDYIVEELIIDCIDDINLEDGVDDYNPSILPLNELNEN